MKHKSITSLVYVAVLLGCSGAGVSTSEPKPKPPPITATAPSNSSKPSPLPPPVTLPDPDSPVALRQGFITDCQEKNVSKDDIEPWLAKTDPVAGAFVGIFQLKPITRYTCEEQYEALLKEEDLFVSIAAVESIEPVKYLTHLTYFSLDRTQVRNLTPLLNNQNLESISITSNETLTDEAITILASFPRLRRVRFDETQLSNISFLNQIKNLREAQLWRNQITDLSPVANLSNEVDLTVKYNPINPELFCHKPATNQLVQLACSSPEGLQQVVHPNVEQ